MPDTIPLSKLFAIVRTVPVPTSPVGASAVHERFCFISSEIAHYHADDLNRTAKDGSRYAVVNVARLLGVAK